MLALGPFASRKRTGLRLWGWDLGQRREKLDAFFFGHEFGFRIRELRLVLMLAFNNNEGVMSHDCEVL